MSESAPSADPSTVPRVHEADAASGVDARLSRPLMISVFAIATCGLIYELLAGTIASYLLGDSVTQFSTIIGAYLFAMGVGSYLSGFVTKDLLRVFIRIEILVGLIGGLSSPVLFLAYSELNAFRFVLYGWVGLTGVLVGLEIPLLLRILKDVLPFRDLVSQVLALDYLGALAASLVFPLWLVPQLGLMRSSFVFGVLNILVAIWTCHLFRHLLKPRLLLTVQAYAVLALLLAGTWFSSELMTFSEQRLYQDRVVMARSSPYQRLVVTRGGGETRLFLDGNLQFSTLDEYRYHEALVHPGLAAVANPRRVLVLGGGDGLAVREVLRDPRVESVTLVDLDPLMTEIFRDHDELSRLNQRALRSDKLTVVNADAFVWLERRRLEGNLEGFDFIVIDFPDPRSYSLGKLYTTTFYRRLEPHLAPDAIVAIQSTSPLFARRAFWCIVETIRSVGFTVRPYHAAVPSFGEWGFVLAARQPITLADQYPPGLRFLDAISVRAMFDFPEDMKALPVEINQLNNQVLVRYHAEGWDHAAAGS